MALLWLLFLRVFLQSLLLGNIVVNRSAKDVVAHWQVFAFAALVYYWLRGAEGVLNDNIFFVGGVRHADWLLGLFLLVGVTHWVKSMGRTKLPLVPLAIPWWVLSSWVRISFGLHLYEMRSLDQGVWGLLHILGLGLSRVVVWKVGWGLRRDLLIVGVDLALGLLVYVLSTLLRLLSCLFSWLFTQELLAAKSIDYRRWTSRGLLELHTLLVVGACLTSGWGVSFAGGANWGLSAMGGDDTARRLLL